MENYEIVRRLSTQGACGQVFFARDKRNGNRTVVVKQLPASDNRSAIERRVMRNLRHANIVQYLDSWMSYEDGTKFQQQQQQQQQQSPQPGKKNPAAAAPATEQPQQQQQQQQQLTLNIAMEFCKGGDLRSAIRARRASEGVGFPEDAIRKWTVQMCSALYYCHIQHILHRDLKAENVLLDETGSHCRLADFGFAKELAESTAFATTRLGTPHSLPPEVYDFTPYNNRADMWCVGVILYELMTLQRPFLGNSTRELFDNILKSDPVPAETVSRGRYSAELYALQKRLLSKNPKNRPGAREVLEQAWAAPLLREVRLLPLSEEQRARERSAWDRITVQAQYPRTVIMELALPDTKVNVRNAPDFERSSVVCQLHQGDVIEVIDEVVDAADLRWFRTTRGFCIKQTPMPPIKDMFRRIAEWRVQRPSSSNNSSPSASSNSTANNNPSSNNNNNNGVGGAAGATAQRPPPPPPAQQNTAATLLSATPTFSSPSSDENDTKSSEDAAKKALEIQVKAYENEAVASNPEALSRFLVTELLKSGVSEELLEDLLRRYRDLATSVDDLPWTMYAVDLLRGEKLVPFIPVIRAIVLAVASSNAAAPAAATAATASATAAAAPAPAAASSASPPTSKAVAAAAPKK